MTKTATHDVVIVGGGHNGLVAAAYLAKAGKNVILLERLDHVGGAAVSAQAFDGIEAWLSRYSYLVSLLPQRIISDLGLDIRLIKRRVSSYTPAPGDAEGLGLLVETSESGKLTDASIASFERLGIRADADGFAAFTSRSGRLARALWPTLTEPLLSRSEAASLVDDSDWAAMIERPIGEVIERTITGDLPRGLVFTDALIGTFAGANDESLAQNRCLLYHVIGGGSGDWDVPVGGMGAVTSELARAARDAGARIVTGAEVVSVRPNGEVRYRRKGRERLVVGSHVLANVAPYLLDQLLEAPTPAGAGPVEPRPEGAQVKVNLMLSRLPRLRETGVPSEIAFAGTFHINEGYAHLATAQRRAARGMVPDPLPCEIYCHSLSDPSVLDPELAASGAHCMTVFALHTPDRWLTADNNEMARQQLQAAVLASLNSVLDERIEDLLMTDAAGNACIETKTTRDLQDALGMPGGNIFHGPLSWPFVEDDAPLSTPAERWGVGTAHARILVCGAGSRRGGGVSGIGGHNAAMAVLEG